jgi:phospholipid transport system substrate-binding protein
MRVIIAALVSALLLVLPRPSLAGPAADDIGVQAERILAVLADPQLRVPGRERARRQAVRRVAEDAIDFSEIGRRTLGPHWDRRTDAEREAFVALFTDLLDRAFLRHIDRWDGERLVVAGDTVDGDHATVHARVLLRDGSQATSRCSSSFAPRWTRSNRSSMDG